MTQGPKSLIELLQIAIGQRVQLSIIPSEQEWQVIFDLSLAHCVAGICFASIQKLYEHGCALPNNLFYKWLCIAATIQKKNKMMDLRTEMLWKRLTEDGLSSAILKGQGIAYEYRELSSLRQSGDIDVWILGGYRTVRDYVMRTIPTSDFAYHHFHYPFYPDLQVELHHRPTMLRNIIKDKKLSKWYNGYEASQFIFLEEKGFAVPPPSFNRIFILAHTFRHFLFEGVGMRQMLDCYFILHNSQKSANEDFLLKSLGLSTFAGAVMWVLNSQFGLEEGKIICKPNEKEGRFLLREIFMAGNFGHTDRRYRFKYLRILRKLIGRSAHLLIHYPSEILWTPIWLVYHKYWKYKKRRELNAI